MNPGIFIGILIGIVSGTVALILLKALNKASIKKVSQIVSLTAEFLAIPTFMFGGQWVSTDIIRVANFDIGSYLISLALTFILMVIYPIFRWVAQLGEELGKGGG